ncbi:MAG: UDP-N-acetylmuramoyl-tripeptide--D-alanyl-D-alanine ligase [Actinomycetota bacterium]
MKPRPLSEIAAAVGGVLHGHDAVASAVVIDSRAASSGSLFIALPGEHVDGHDFVAEALANGAVGAVVSRRNERHNVIEVEDTGQALLELAADERRLMGHARVVGVTGANGKTSTKDFTAAVLASRFRTHASPQSFNTEIGLPLTLLGTPEGTEVVVAEMGARRAGDVSLLCEVARPEMVVVTNVGVAHMEMFGSWETIVEASAEPVEALGDDGVAILCADDRIVRGYAERTRARVITFGLSPDADVRAEDMSLDEGGCASFVLVAGRERERVELAIPGEHMVQNALGAAACGMAFGVTAAECSAALKAARITHWRMETFVSSNGVRVVNDAYNANPESTAAGLRAARWMARDGRMAAVLGHMAELGPIALAEHERLGELIVRMGVDRLVTVGAQAATIAHAALCEGALPDDVASYETVEEAVEDIRAWARPGDVVLVKASRVVGLERVAEALR